MHLVTLSLKMATFSAFWALAHVARGAMAHPGPPWIRQCSCRPREGDFAPKVYSPKRWEMQPRDIHYAIRYC